MSVSCTDCIAKLRCICRGCHFVALSPLGAAASTPPTPDAPAMRDRPARAANGGGRELDEPPQVLRGRGEQDLVPRAAQASQPKPVEPEDALHMRKSHLDLFALAARLLEGLGVGQRPDAVAHILVDISCDLANDRCRTLG